jgi:Zn-dependent protease with chaperone function
VNGWLGTLQLAALLLLAGGAAVSLATALAAPVLLPRLRRIAPEARARWLSLLAAAPLALPVAAVALCLSPSLPAAFGLHADHCRLHPEHRHLCIAHGAGPLGQPWSAAAMLAGAPLVAGLGFAGAAFARGRRLAARLRLGSPRSLPGGVRVVDSPVPLSLAVGGWRPRIFVSERLVSELAPDQLAIVIAHERAHVRRRDGLRGLLSRAASGIHLPATRRRVLAELGLACEQACDAEAARHAGTGRLRVAETILAAERLLQGGAPAGAAACAFAGSSVADRVGELLEARSAAIDRRRLRALALGLGLGAALAAAEPLHHLAEHLLAVWIR